MSEGDWAERGAVKGERFWLDAEGINNLYSRKHVVYSRGDKFVVRRWPGIDETAFFYPSVAGPFDSFEAALAAAMVLNET